MKQTNRPIEVLVDGERLHAIREGRRTCRVLQVLDHWIVHSYWLTGGKTRVYYRVLTEKGLTELYQADGKWTMSKRGLSCHGLAGLGGVWRVGSRE